MYRTFLICLCLTLCSACTTAADKPKPQVIVTTKEVKRRVPAALIEPCEKEYDVTKLRTVGDLETARADNAAKLNRCAAKVAGVAAWDAR